MPGYTLKNLKELDDALAGQDYGIEARFARKHLDSEHLGVSYFRYDSGTRASVGHRHGEQEEAYIVLSGSGRIKLDDDIVDLKPWDVVRVAPEVIRGFEAGPDGLEVLAVGSDRPEGGDGEMVKDFWPD